jgi:hypothetical protein
MLALARHIKAVALKSYSRTALDRNLNEQKCTDVTSSTVDTHSMVLWTALPPAVSSAFAKVAV